MGLALNLIALLLVIGASWAAMLWMSGRFHGTRQDFTAEPLVGAHDRVADDLIGEVHGAERSGELDGLFQAVVDGSELSATDCSTCQGSGARKYQGRLAPCVACNGTGVLS